MFHSNVVTWGRVEVVPLSKVFCLWSVARCKLPTIMCANMQTLCGCTIPLWHDVLHCVSNITSRYKGPIVVRPSPLEEFAWLCKQRDPEVVRDPPIFKKSYSNTRFFLEEDADGNASFHPNPGGDAASTSITVLSSLLQASPTSVPVI